MHEALIEITNIMAGLDHMRTTLRMALADGVIKPDQYAEAVAHINGLSPMADELYALIRNV